MRIVPLTVIAISLAGASGPLAGVALAQGERGRVNRAARDEVQSRTAQAMENFDLLEFEAARKQLGDAAVLARKYRLDSDPVLANVFLSIGIVEFAGMKNTEAARRAFAAAVAIDPQIEIGVAYRTDAMAELLKAVKKEEGGRGRSRSEPEEVGGEDDGGDPGDERDCALVEGLEHTLVDRGRVGRRQPITARVGSTVGAERVSLFYRAAGTEKFTELKMRRGSGCLYRSAIPAQAMKGDAIHYYVAAVKDGQTLASRGSRASPNIIELGPAGASGDTEDPLEGEVSESAGERPPPGEKKTLFLSLAVGTGGGYVSGTTEVVGSDVDCCFAPALLHLFPEVGYYFTRRLSLSAAFRMGFALGANVLGHATAAPAGLLRLRYALSEACTGLQLSAVAGGGIIRNTVKVEEAADGMDTDTTASGPFLVGGGLGYLYPLSGVMQLVAELNGLAAFPAGIKELGPCPGSGCVRPNFGVQVDINLGILFAF
jgi:hypothetical protein